MSEQSLLRVLRDYISQLRIATRKEKMDDKTMPTKLEIVQSLLYAPKLVSKAWNINPPGKGDEETQVKGEGNATIENGKKLLLFCAFDTIEFELKEIPTNSSILQLQLARGVQLH